MNRNDIMQELTEIFRDVFDDDSIVLAQSSTANDIEDWDSLAQINIIVACESKFKVKFNMQEVASLNNVGDFLHMLEGKLKQ